MAEEMGKMLSTMGEIVNYVGRDKRTIKKWIEQNNFPAVKIDGRWESNTRLIDKFRKKQIESACLAEAE